MARFGGNAIEAPQAGVSPTRPIVTGLTFDTGALIALERRDRRMSAVLARATASALVITVLSAVLVEWWRGGSRVRRRILDAIRVEPLSAEVACTAGEALAVAPRGPSIVDAVVMASAAQRGDVVYTADLVDLERLRTFFPAVRVLRV